MFPHIPTAEESKATQPLKPLIEHVKNYVGNIHQSAWGAHSLKEAKHHNNKARSIQATFNHLPKKTQKSHMKWDDAIKLLNTPI